MISGMIKYENIDVDRNLPEDLEVLELDKNPHTSIWV